MMSTLSIHMWSNPIAKQSHPLKGTCLDHSWLKSAVWQSPPTWGTFWATFGWSSLRDKVLRWGAHFGPHLVNVRCMTKFSNKEHILGHIWLKSAAWQSPSTRGTFWATFSWSPLRDKVLQWGAHLDHIWSKSAAWQSSNEGHILGHIWLKSAAWQSPPTRGTFWATFGQSPLHDKVLQQGAHFGPYLVKVRSETKSSNEGHNCFCHIWPLSAAWQLCLMANHGYHFLATFGQSLLCDTFSFLC